MITVISHDNVAASQNVTIATLDATTRGLLELRRARNKVTRSGRQVLVELLGRAIEGTASGYAPHYIGLGTGTAGVLDTDEALATEAYRNLITVRRKFDSKVLFQLFLAKTDGNGAGTVQYTEAGLFDALGAGNMFGRVVFSPVTKSSSVLLVLSWEVRLTSL